MDASFSIDMSLRWSENGCPAGAFNLGFMVSVQPNLQFNVQSYGIRSMPTTLWQLALGYHYRT